MIERRRRNAMVALTAGALLALPVTAQAAGPTSGEGRGGSRATDLDVLFVGAHPDDEAFGLATYGQWNELDDAQVGVITVTRGEGGGNAVGLEEGPALGVLREAEERRAVAHANIEHVYNLDKVDYYYTASAPLTAQAWDSSDTLERIVRVIRETTPEVIVTMDPSPTAGQHGHHQQAARLAVQAYAAAADPAMFPEQLTDEGLQPWSVSRILRSGATGQGTSGSACETTPFVPTDASDRVFGTWQGRASTETGELWATRERQANWEYVSQGWAVFPPAPTDPEANGCDFFTLIDSRTPYPDAAVGGTAALQGAVLPIDGGLPLGTQLDIETSQFNVLPGTAFDATVTVTAGGKRPLRDAELAVAAPAGWTVEVGDVPRTLRPGRTATVDVVVTPPADAALGERVALKATLTAGGAAGSNEVAVETSAAVRGQLAQRPEAKVFADWTAEVNLPKLESLIPTIASVGVGRTQPVTIDVVNDGATAASGSVALELAEGFVAEPATQSFDELAPGSTTSVTFEVTNTDTTLPTSNRAPDGGYPFEVVTTFDGGADTQQALLELVPTTEIPQVASAPTVDGVVDAAEYPGEAIDTSTIWEGDDVTPEDAAATTHVSFTDDALYVAVTVTDDTLGTVLPPEDCKRHWRTDSVEITVDPRGTSSNTSTTFKTGIFPITDDPAAGNPACFERDADNHQGPGAETAPGMEVASTVADPYGGYTVEAKIPFSVLPDTVDPARMGLNVLVYDSDTQDKTGQSRLGWSTFNGVQADPFRWALATLPGLEAAPSAPVEPTLPSDVARSVESPQSIAQSAVDGVPLGGGPGLSERSARLGSVRVDGDAVAVRVTSRVDGTANLYVRSGGEVVGSLLGAEVERGTQTIRVPVSGVTDDVEVLAAVITEKGTLALAR